MTKRKVVPTLPPDGIYLHFEKEKIVIIGEIVVGTNVVALTFEQFARIERAFRKYVKAIQLAQKNGLPTTRIRELRRGYKSWLEQHLQPVPPTN